MASGSTGSLSALGSSSMYPAPIKDVFIKRTNKKNR